MEKKRDDLMQKLDKAQFDIEPEAGMQFQADTGQGPTVITIVEVDETTVTVDGNHPLAGVTLNFDVDLLEVREATKEELDQGRVQADDDACCSGSGCGC
jgi:FKBP-type peptidyl-prolyl cis-trans isomerase SlyD